MLKDTLEIAKKGKSFFQGLTVFLKQYSVIGLAIGVVVGQASKDLVDSIVKGAFTPLIKLIVPAALSGLTFTVDGAVFDFGIVLNAGLTFVIVMAFLYFVIKFIIKNEAVLDKK
ncbi:MAG: MscL family protein [Candidatus Falkowbacteria bacterium]|nr:MscL family protein [Candidatus Falkowbacteria bacterium]